MKIRFPLLLVAVVLIGFHTACSNSYHPKATHRSVASWLEREAALEEMEEILAEIPDLRNKLEEFTQQMETGDELWWYSSPERRGLYYGEAGYAIVRNSQVIDWFRIIHFAAHGESNG